MFVVQHPARRVLRRRRPRPDRVRVGRRPQRVLGRGPRQLFRHQPPQTACPRGQPGAVYSRGDDKVSQYKSQSNVVAKQQLQGY